jgi:DNA-binding NarL/FixJ family response regulator
MRDITVAVVDDHPIVCEGLVRVISDCPGFQIVGTAATASAAKALALDLAPDLLLLDLGIPGLGLSIIADIARGGTGTSVVVLSASENPDDVICALRQGAAAYILKGIGGATLCEVLRTVASGSGYVTPHLAARLIASMETLATAGPPDEARILSKREAEIHALIRQGCCNKDIGRRLSLSEKTVKHYLTNMFRKLDVRNRTELALHSPWR